MNLGRFKAVGCLLAAAVGLAAAWASCAEGGRADCGVGGVADTAAYDASFNQMELIDEATSQPGPPGGDGVIFPAATKIAVRVDAKKAVSLRLCLGNRTSGKIELDQTKALEAGVSTHSLGTFAVGSYVVRSAVAGTLVKNLAFDTQ